MDWKSWLLVAALTPTLAVAQEGDKPAKPEMALRVKGLAMGTAVSTWPTGLQMAVVHDELSPMVVTQILVDAGWRYDPADALGMAALFERAWWASEVAPGVRAVDQLVNGYGCEVDSMVDHDLLRFTSTCPKQTVDAAMRVWSRLFTDPLAGVTDELLKAEAVRIRSDAQARYQLTSNEPIFLARHAMMALYPEGHPYHGGSWDSAGAIGLARIKAWAASNVTVARTTVGLMGGFSGEHPLHGPALVGGNFEPRLLDPKLTPELVVRWPHGDLDEVDPDDLSLSWGWPSVPSNPRQGMELGRARPGPAKGTEPPKPPEPASVPFQRMSGGVDETTILVSWSLPGSWRKEDPLHAVLARVIAAMVADPNHMDEPTIKRLAGCYVVPGLEAATLTCAAILKDGYEASGERVSGRIIDQISYITDINNRPNVDVAVSLGRLRVLTDAIHELDEQGNLYASRTYWLNTGVHLVGDPGFWSKRMGDINPIAPQQVIDYAARYITRARSRSVQVDIDPQAGTAPYIPRLDPKDRDALAARPGYWNLLATRPAPASVPGKRIDAARVTSSVPRFKESDIAYNVLPNGMRVVVVPIESSPAVEVRLVAGLGLLNDPTEHMTHAYARGLIAFHREKADDIGGAWYAYVGDTVSVLGLRASAENLDGAVWLLRDALDGVNISFKDKITFVSTWKKKIQDSWYDVQHHVDGNLRRHLYGDSLLSRQVGWDDFTYWGEVGTDQLRDMMRVRWAPENITLVISGGVDGGQGMSIASSFFQGWRAPAPSVSDFNPAAISDVPMPSSKVVHIYPSDKSGGLAELALGCRVPGNREAALAAAALVQQGLGTSFTTVQSTVDAFPGDTQSVVVRARVPEANAGAALKVLLGRLEAAAGGKVPEDELRAAVWRAAMSDGDAFTSDRRVAMHITELIGDGREWKDDSSSAARFGKLDPATVAAAFSSCASAPYVAVIGDSGALTSSLGGAGVTATPYDWKAAGEAEHKTADPKGYEKMKKKGG